MSRRYKKSYRKNFIILPITFFILGYLVLFVAFAPVISPLSSVLDLVFLDKPVNFSSDYASLFSSSQTPNQSSDEIKASELTLPEFGTHFGQLTIPGTQVDAGLFFGDGDKELKNGVGIYNGSFIPGYGKTVLVAGHNHIYFHDLGSAQVGGTIEISTNYGQYVYEITGTKITTAQDNTAYDLDSEEENLVLYTCYPFDQIGLTPERYFVYAKYLSGPKINIYE